MDQFERVISVILEQQNFWTKQSHRVTLSHETKLSLGKPKMPSPEIDILAYRPEEDMLHFFEVKSYFDSGSGVTINEVNGENADSKTKYRLIHDQSFASAITESVLSQFRRTGLVGESCKSKFHLVLGNVDKRNSKKICDFLQGRDWGYWGPAEIEDGLRAVAKTGYRNDSVSFVAKLLLRAKDA